MEKFKVAVVEDDKAAAEKLRGFLTRYSEEHGVEFETTVYSDAVFFLWISTCRT